MQANQALLEKLVEERPYCDREAFVRFVADTLRTAPQEQYVEMKELIFDMVHKGRRRQPGDIEQPFKSLARPAKVVPYSFQQHNPQDSINVLRYFPYILL